MSVSYAVDFASLLLLGPHETMLVAAGSAFSQCHLNKQGAQPAVSHAVQHRVAGHHGAGRRPRVPAARRRRLGDAAHRARASAGRRRDGLLPAEHRSHRDGDRAVDAQQRSPTTWHNNFLWSAPSYFVGAGTRRARGVAGRHTPATGWRRFTFAPLYLMYRTYKVYMGRIEDEQRHVQQTSDLHLATIEALARAIDAKDQTTQMHIRRVQVYAAGLAKAAGPQRRTKSRASRRRRCCTTSASWRCPSTSCRSPVR